MRTCRTLCRARGCGAQHRRSGLSVPLPAICVRCVNARERGRHDRRGLNLSRHVGWRRDHDLRTPAIARRAWPQSRPGVSLRRLPQKSDRSNDTALVKTISSIIAAICAELPWRTKARTMFSAFIRLALARRDCALFAAALRSPLRRQWKRDAKLVDDSRRGRCDVR